MRKWSTRISKSSLQGIVVGNSRQVLFSEVPNPVAERWLEYNSGASLPALPAARCIVSWLLTIYRPARNSATSPGLVHTAYHTAVEMTAMGEVTRLRRGSHTVWISKQRCPCQHVTGHEHSSIVVLFWIRGRAVATRLFSAEKNNSPTFVDTRPNVFRTCTSRAFL